MPEVADIFQDYGQAYRKEHSLPYRTHKVINAIQNCRTAKLGGHRDSCNICGHIRISYNSCRDRHCPKCQGLAREKWVLNRKKDLLPIGYFHVVLTIPAELNPLVIQNQKELYGLLFKAGSDTLMELAKDPKYLGAEPGLISILHTWGQNLMHHPHLHFIVTGGGLSPKGDKWISSKERFFLPVKVISRLFRGKFMSSLKKLHLNGMLTFAGDIDYLQNPKSFKELLNKLYEKEWVSYCKPPFDSVGRVLEYIGRYTHRVAISNNRIKGIKDDKVTFQWRDYKNLYQSKLMTLDVNEFIRRFLLHVLPDRFVKIRYYGLLTNRNRKVKVQRCRESLKTSIEEIPIPTVYWKTEEKKVDFNKCPCCGKGVMVGKTVVLPRKNGPPANTKLTA